MALVAMGAVLLLSAAQTYAADSKPDDAGYVKIINVATGKLLALEHESDAASDQAVIAAEAKGSHAQQWKLEKNGDFYQLVNRANGLALDVNGWSTDAGASIILWDAKGAGDQNDNQQWSWEQANQASDKGVRINSKSSGLVLDVDDAGKIVQQGASNTAKSQLWRIVYVLAPAYVKLVNANSHWVLAPESDSGYSGARAVVAKDADSKDKPNKEHQWKLEKDGSFYKIVQRPTGLVLDVSGDSSDEDGAIILYDDKSAADGNDNQRWSWEGGPATADKPRRLKSKSSGLVLDVDDEGNIVQRSPSEKSKGQMWLMVEVKE
jgi:hypothetical protein